MNGSSGLNRLLPGWGGCEAESVIVVRTQIQLTDRQARKLKQLAAARGRSMADLIRASVDVLLARPDSVDDDERRRRAIAVAGRFRSGAGDLASAHDRHLADVFRQ